jgi:hypothetical protein
MASAKAKQIRERLEQIKFRAAEINAAEDKRGRSNAVSAADLAEEAAGLGIELADLLDAKGK